MAQVPVVNIALSAASDTSVTITYAVAPSRKSGLTCGVNDNNSKIGKYPIHCVIGTPIVFIMKKILIARKNTGTHL